MEANIVKKDGKASMDKDINYMLSLLPNGEFTLTIKRKVKHRTLNQNALMWVWLRYVGCALSEQIGDRFYSTKDGIDALYNGYIKKFLRIRIPRPDGTTETVQRHSSQLNTREMSNFMEAIKMDVLEQFGISVPLPTDEYYSAFEMEYKNKY